MSDEAKKAYDDERKARDKANKKAQEDMDNAVPTPTQEENDKARLGILEADGGAPLNRAMKTDRPPVVAQAPDTKGA